MTTDFRALCAELADAYLRLLEYINNSTWLGYEPSDDPLLLRARAALADGPAVPEGREPASVTGQPNDEELLETLDKATATFPPRHPEAEGLNVVEYALALELRKARAVLARWGTSNLAETRSSLGGMPTPVPADKGEVEELVVELRMMASQAAEACQFTDAENLSRAADLLQRLSPPQPVPVSVSDALIKAECALSDIAEGEPMTDEGDPLQWAERRCADTLAIIRPWMKQYGIRTSEWPPLPAHALPIPQQQEDHQ